MNVSYFFQPTKNEHIFRNISIFYNTCVIGALIVASPLYTKSQAPKVQDVTPQPAPQVIVVDQDGRTAADRALDAFSAPVESPQPTNTPEPQLSPSKPATEQARPKAPENAPYSGGGEGYYLRNGRFIPRATPNNNTDEFEDLSNGRTELLRQRRDNAAATGSEDSPAESE